MTQVGTDTLLEILNLWKSYNGHPAVRGMDLTVQRGEIFGLLGPNGAGKTTILKIVVGLLKMDKGVVRVDGGDIEEDQYEYKRVLGYLPESLELPEYLTVEEFLGYVARVRNVPKDTIAERANTYLSMLDLEDRKGDLIVTLSRGMKQKLGMSAALIHDPHLLLLDEPLVGIDPSGQHTIKAGLREMVRHGGSVLVSTHMLDTAERLCDRVGIIHRGRNVVAGHIERLRGLAETGENSTLEQVFLKLTQEEEELVEEPKRGKGLFGWFRR
ncbi:MAG: ABC transporter ATP-binding protein [Candidatus Geothermarchaeales archaeon]